MVTTPKPTPGNGDEKKINPETMIIPDPEIIAFLAETRGVGQDAILKTFEPSIYLPDLAQINLCIQEAFGIDYVAPEGILPHIGKFIDDNASDTFSELDSDENSIKLYFSDKDEFRKKLGYENFDKRKMIEVGDALAEKFEILFKLLIEKISYRKAGE